MRIATALLLPGLLGVSAAFAQSSPPAPAPSAVTKAAKPKDNAAADCILLWDAATHMTKQEWARTCHRVQTRLDNLKIDNLKVDTGAPAKTARKKKGT